MPKPSPTRAELARDGLVDAIGNTPLIALPKLSAVLGRTILGKAEFLNPGGSVKDRAARGIIEDFERRGLLAPGGTVVEGTAGNTGIGLALVGNAREYRTVIVMPDDQAAEKYGLLRTFGADLRVVPAAPFTNSANYYHEARRVAESIPGAVWANQFENTANRAAHEATTGPEILAQTGGELSAFVAAAGTGGTIAGVGRALKAHDPHIRVVLADPYGSGLFSYVKTGELADRGRLERRGNRDQAYHRELRRRAGRRRAARRRSHDGRDGALAAALRRIVRRRIRRAQRRRRGAVRANAARRQRRRHGAVRRRRTLSLATVRCGLAARERRRAGRAGPRVPMSETKLSHVREDGSLAMVDVGAKAPTARTARAEARVRLNPAAAEALRAATLAKGDAFAAAQLAGIMAAKRTDELIPLAHPIALGAVDVSLRMGRRDDAADRQPRDHLRTDRRRDGSDGRGERRCTDHL